MSVHISAKKEEIAKLVIMPGDPLRAKYIAEKYLVEPKLVSNVRLNLVYTGYYKDKLVTVMSSGMGMPSMGIYATELYNEYDVEKIIRVGSCGSYYEEIKLRDIILVEKAYTTSSFACQLSGIELNLIKGSSFLNQKIIDTAFKKNLEIRIGNINTTDVFYNDFVDSKIKENFCLGVEMETFALFYIAKKYNKEAASILTVSDSLITKEELSSEDRETTFNEAIILALESI